MSAPALIILVSLLAAASPALAPAPTPGGGVRELGSLVLDGLPEIPARVAERTMQYQNVRAATLLDWDPEGGGMLVSTRFGETFQVHHVAAPGASREQLTFFAEPVAEAAYDPARGRAGFYLRMDRGGGEFHQYYWLDRAAGRPVLVTDGASRNEGLVVARAGGKYAYASTRRNKKDFDVYVGEGTDPAGARLAVELEGQWTPVDFSPAGDRLLLLQYVSANESYVHLLELANGKLTPLTPRAPGSPAVANANPAFGERGDVVFFTSDADAEFQRLVRLDLARGTREVVTRDTAWDVERLAVSKDGKWLAYTVNEGGTSTLFLAPARSPGKARRVDTPTGVIGALAFDHQGRRLGLSLSTPRSPADVYAVDVQAPRLTRWTFSEVGGLDPASFVSPELVEAASFDGRRIPAWYYRPRRASAPAPLVIQIHGGPEGQARPGFEPVVQQWVNELGAAVLVPNVRGSSGYGKSYLLLDNGVRREDSVKDLGAFLDWAAARPEIDRERIAVMGGSYGGYMVLAALTHFGERLRCAVDVVGISNFVSFLESTEAYRRDLRRAEYGDERDPETRAFLARISPLANAARIRAPLLVVQGKNDPRVPANESEQIVRTVRGQGKPVWYLLARDEGHGFRKKQNRDVYLNAMTFFFEQHLLPRAAAISGAP